MEFIKNIVRKGTIFNDLSRPIIPYFINLIYFKGKKPNVGDELSPIIFNYLLNHFNQKNRINKRTIRVSFIGSIIQFLSAKTIVYGSGLMLKSSSKKFLDKRLDLDIRAVRGPLTRNALIEVGYNVPKVFGDPAILLPLFYQPKRREIKYDYIIIPHWKKIDTVDSHEHIVSPITTDWKSFINAICASSLVISSSLHGIILAEAYGVPAILLNDTEHDDLFKYHDYYASTGREFFNKASSISEALSLKPDIIPSFNILQEGLLNNFPFK